MNESSAREMRKLVRKKVSGHVDVMDLNREETLGRLVNIHQEGLMVVGDVLLSPDSLYRVRLCPTSQFDGVEALDIDVDCLWVRDSADNGVNWSGFYIADIAAENKPKLQALIDLMCED